MKKSRFRSKHPALDIHYKRIEYNAMVSFEEENTGDQLEFREDQFEAKIDRWDLVGFVGSGRVYSLEIWLKILFGFSAPMSVGPSLGGNSLEEFFMSLSNMADCSPSHESPWDGPRVDRRRNFRDALKVFHSLSS